MRAPLGYRNHHFTESKGILIVDTEGGSYYDNFSLLFKDCKIELKKNICEAKKYYSTNILDIAIINNSSKKSCMNLLKFFKSTKPLVHVIIIAECGSEEFAVEAFRNGAKDYFNSRFDIKELETRIRSLLNLEEIKKRRRSDYAPDNFRSAVGYIIENYNRKIGLPEVAQKAGMSVSCFERTFKKKLGETFSKHVNNLRISSAKQMLKNHNLNISDIAYYSGFTNQYHFSRTFKKIVTISPTRYRAFHK